MQKNMSQPAGMTADQVSKMTGLRPLKFISIDPGDVHVGWVEWDNLIPVFMQELTPPEAAERLKKNLESKFWDAVVIEDFRLYAKEATVQIGSDMPTCQLIGVIKYISEQYQVDWLMQGAGIKEPTRGVLRHKEIELLSKQLGLSGHVQDAELHGWHFMLNGYKRFERAYGVSLRK